MDVGLIGLGIMGAPMAGHLIARGHRLHRKTRRSVPEPPLPAGDIAGAREVAKRSDVVIREGAVTAERCERGCNVHGRPYRVLGKRKALFLIWSKDAVLDRRADLLGGQALQPLLLRACRSARRSGRMPRLRFKPQGRQRPRRPGLKQKAHTASKSIMPLNFP
ncbi:hypothetical protein AO398_11785 [Methylobacterium sp. GXS13]|uniref:NAD(P)-binding domain-containing protein n=1 Tax=Methylobacterium sp. GXS13 TaxID=1730094 RepID=UPI00071B5319|nr:NAD(P)-binding domain-containing protein [Methylobacterium sp. GXS13]KST60977.1 hypothetical protein AO398_11785 [Methylobacterium sp. GXS13]